MSRSAVIFSCQRSRVFVHPMPRAHVEALIAASQPLDVWPIRLPGGRAVRCRAWNHPFQGLFYQPL